MRVFVLSSLLLIVLTGCNQYYDQYPQGYKPHQRHCDAKCHANSSVVEQAEADIIEFEDFEPLEPAPTPLSTFDEQDFREYGLK